MSIAGQKVTGYINAGGRGTRLNGVFTPNPETGIAKALLELGEPSIRLIDHHIANLRYQGIDDVVVAAGDQEELYEYIGDVYADDKDICATSSRRQLGTGGDLVNYASQANTTANLLIQNVDTILDIDLSDFSENFALFQKLGGVACIALTTNQDSPNKNAYAVNNLDKVEHSIEFCAPDEISPVFDSYSYSASSTGAVLIDAAYLKNRAWHTQNRQLSIYKHILREAWEDKSLFAYNNGERFFRDIGTVTTWLSSQNDQELQTQLRYNTNVHPIEVI